mgnify:CR=1 FL=1
MYARWQLISQDTAAADNRMIEEFLDMLINESGPTKSTTSVEQSVESHYCALAAEESRLNGGAVIELDTYRR